MFKGMGGLGGLGDMGKMMKAAQEMQAKMEEMQEALANEEVTAESGGGLVKATATAKGEIVRLDIDPSIFQPSEKEVVEDLIVAAIREAQEKGKVLSQKRIADITQGLGLPPGIKLPF